MEENREEYKQKVRAGFKNLITAKEEGGMGISPELVAHNLHVSWTSIKSWIAGRRTPQRAVVERAQDIFRIRIL